MIAFAIIFVVSVEMVDIKLAHIFWDEPAAFAVVFLENTVIHTASTDSDLGIWGSFPMCLNAPHFAATVAYQSHGTTLSTSADSCVSVKLL